MPSPVFGFFFGNRVTVVVRFSIQRLTRILNASRESLAGSFYPSQTTNKKGKYMKKLLLIALVASGFAFASAPRSDAGVAVGIGPVGIGVGVGYPYYGYGYYPYGYDRPHSYYGPYYYYGGPSYYCYNARRGHGHHPPHH